VALVDLHQRRQRTLSAKANERYLRNCNGWIEQSRKYEGQQMSPARARAIMLLKLQAAMPPRATRPSLRNSPSSPPRWKACTAPARTAPATADRECRQLGELEDVLREDRDYDDQLDAWQGWHTIAQPMRKDYSRFADLLNDGASDWASPTPAKLWRSGYDMTPREIAAETDRLWGQVKPLYEQLHCYARTQLQAKYGDRGASPAACCPRT
jgi:peptidyl-dipeptidase A